MSAYTSPWPYSAYEGPYGPKQVSHRSGRTPTGAEITACGKTFDPDREDWGVGGPNPGFVPNCGACQRVLYQPLGGQRADIAEVPWRADGDRVVTFVADGTRESLVADFPSDELAAHVADAHNEWIDPA